MNHKVKLKEILDFLNKNNITFSLIKKSNVNKKYTFASINKIITKGIYYFTDPEKIVEYGIKDSIIITSQKVKTDNILIIVSNPKLVHYKLTNMITEKIKKEISKSSKINRKAKIGKNVSIGENCVIGNCVIEKNVIIKHNVVIEDNVHIEENCFIDSNSVIGAKGLAWIWDDNGERIIQNQIGGVIIKKNCIIATDVTIVRGSLSEDTIIAEDTVIAHGTKIGHGSNIGKKVHMANNVSLAGNAKVGNYSFLGSGSIVSSNVSIPSNTIVGAGTLVTKSFEEEYLTLVGVPAKILKKNNYTNKPKGAPKPFKK